MDKFLLYHASLNKHAPCKIKYVRGNQIPFSEKKTIEADMTRTKLRNLLQNTSEENRNLYAKQRNFCLSFKKDQKRYHEILSEKSFIDNRLF